MDSITKKLAKIRVQASTLAPRTPDRLLPHRWYGDVVREAQALSHLDAKYYVDLVPLKNQDAIRRAYNKEKKRPDFDVLEFVDRYFRSTPSESPTVDAAGDMSEHIRMLWPLLTRQTHKKTGTLVPLPEPYIVPGGRFNELFYWDTYFVMLGLEADGRIDAIENIINNYTFMIRRYGYIPTANRSYLLSRSQPPYFAQMIELLGRHRGVRRTYIKYLPYLLAEYRFWMKGRSRLSAASPARKRVVRMPDSSVLNRYFDELDDPRPELYPEDVATAAAAGARKPSRVYRDIRAAAESGWDFSSRWFDDGTTLASIRTTSLVPVDLNCLLYELEMTISRAYASLAQPLLARQFAKKAAARARSINTYCWDQASGVYRDYDIERAERSPHLTLATVYPLSYGVASDEQASKVVACLEHDFLKAGGVVTTPIDSSQQWDAPNGWAPLQWETIKAARRYGFTALADTIKHRFIGCAGVVYAAHHKLVEKYNVVEVGKPASGGEYELQDGFGWTNGVLQALMSEKE